MVNFNTASFLQSLSSDLAKPGGLGRVASYPRASATRCRCAAWDTTTGST